ncbi:NDUFB9 [Acanthosepion pharaonis]|uniref:NADH dehydrogenase [ubiquinone] 1 beta subcomplex subunit 9 n=1 Tax=Acanthosepion pharaonis TaxID=158019 RepID=A0A812EGH0_ACAPH|nr:NDUFB9 [Sepia pharaonis]
MAYLQSSVLSHAQKVRKLYKDSLRLLQSYYASNRIQLRYESVLLRAKFDENKDEVDLKKAKELINEANYLLWKYQHPQPYKYAHSPGGICYGRDPHMPDWILDTWTPQEKARYPEYFARRDIRKEDLLPIETRNYFLSDDLLTGDDHIITTNVAACTV